MLLRIFSMTMGMCMVLSFYQAPVEALTPSLDGAKAAVLLELASGETILEKNATEAYAVAGIDRMPLLLTLTDAVAGKGLSTDETASTSAMAAEITGPTAFLEAGESMNVDALMQAAIIISAGDAIMTLGEHLFGSEQTFMEQAMNRLEEMGLAKQYTSFFDPARTWSAMELAQLGTAAKTDASFMQHCVIPRSVITHEDGRETELVNANRLLRSYAGCGGLITGSSQADGYSGIFYAARNGMEFICVVIGASSAADRFSIAEAIFNYGFANVKNVTLARAGEAVAEAVPVEEGETEHVDLVVKDTVVLLTETGNETYTQELNIPDPLTAPIFQNESVGTVRFYDEAGKLVAEAPLYPSLDIASYKLIDILKRVCASFLRQYGSLA